MATELKHLTIEALESGLDEIRASPKDEGLLQLIVRRPRIGEREMLDEGELDPQRGLVGDNWSSRHGARSGDGSAYLDTQLNIMNARVIALVARDTHRWPLAGDQLFIDMDLSENNLPPGTHISLGSAVIEVTAEPHTGCSKFAARFGMGAVQFVNSVAGRELRLRGINAKVVQPGVIRIGDRARKIARATPPQVGSVA